MANLDLSFLPWCLTYVSHAHDGQWTYGQVIYWFMFIHSFNKRIYSMSPKVLQMRPQIYQKFLLFVPHQLGSLVKIQEIGRQETLNSVKSAGLFLSVHGMKLWSLKTIFHNAVQISCNQPRSQFTRVQPHILHVVRSAYKWRLRGWLVSSGD